MIRKTRPTDSFFNFFSPPVPPSDEAIESGDIDEEDLEEIDEKLEVDYQIGEDFKEKACICLNLARQFGLMDWIIDYSPGCRLFHWQGP